MTRNNLSWLSFKALVTSFCRIAVHPPISIYHTHNYLL